MSEIRRYIFYLAVIYLVVLAFFTYQKDEQIREVKQRSIEESRQEFFTSQSALDKLSQNFYNDNNDYLSRQLFLALSADRRERDRLREEILDRLYPTFRSASLFGLSQFLVHTRDGKSFVRFRHPRIHGEALADFRPSIRSMMMNHLFLKGFENGKFGEGLHYIYPLFYDGRYVGSYEWVWKQEALIREMKKIHGGWYAIVSYSGLPKRPLPPETEKKKFRPFPGCGHLLYQKSVFGLNGRDFVDLMKDFSARHDLCALWKEKKDFSFPFEWKGRNYLVTLVVIRDIMGKPYGYLIAVKNEKKIARIINTFYIMVGSLSIVILLLFSFVHHIHRDKIFMRTLIDSQKDLVILTNGKVLKEANQAFFDFFDVADIREFVSRYHCICSLFIPAEGYVGDSTRDSDWLQEMIREPDREHRVIIFDREKGEERIFSVSYSRFDHTENYVVAFRDVTELEREKRHFKIESMMDHLTRIYNKRAFEHFLKDKIEDMRFYERKDVALIMFDIDHFKQVNDRYGHQKGDEILAALAEVVQKSIRKSDFFARWGGEEFVIVMDGVTSEKAAEAAETIRKKIAEYAFDVPRKITCSFGVTALRQEDTPAGALERVDRILYRAKNLGRDRVESETDEEKRTQK